MRPPKRIEKTKDLKWVALTLALISIFNTDPLIVRRSLIITRIYHWLINSLWSALHTCRLYFSRKNFRNLCSQKKNKIISNKLHWPLEGKKCRTELFQVRWHDTAFSNGMDSHLEGTDNSPHVPLPSTPAGGEHASKLSDSSTQCRALTPTDSCWNSWQSPFQTPDIFPTHSTRQQPYELGAMDPSFQRKELRHGAAEPGLESRRPSSRVWAPSAPHSRWQNPDPDAGFRISRDLGWGWVGKRTGYLQNKLTQVKKQKIEWRPFFLLHVWYSDDFLLPLTLVCVYTHATHRDKICARVYGHKSPKGKKVKGTSGENFKTIFKHRITYLMHHYNPFTMPSCQNELWSEDNRWNPHMLLPCS